MSPTACAQSALFEKRLTAPTCKFAKKTSLDKWSLFLFDILFLNSGWKVSFFVNSSRISRSKYLLLHYTIKLLQAIHHKKRIGRLTTKHKSSFLQHGSVSAHCWSCGIHEYSYNSFRAGGCPAVDKDPHNTMEVRAIR